MSETVTARPRRGFRRTATVALTLGLCATLMATDPPITERVYFSAVDNVTDVLVQHIDAENVRLDIASWYLSEHAISIAIMRRFTAGVPVRIIGDRAALFENDPHTKNEFYWLASQGVPIRLRFNPTWFPELVHWKMALFVGQGIVEFGSGNFAPTELAPVSATNYSDETELFTNDPALVNAFKTKFDVMWNDQTVEPESVIGSPPYLKDWDDACANEPTGGCADYRTLYPSPVRMNINPARLVGTDYPTPPGLIWGQGSGFNNRVTQEIYNESRRIDVLAYRLEVDNITEAILSRFRAGVPVRVIVDPLQYTKITWPEYWLTHANIDKLWAAGVPIRQSLHAGVMHMKTLVTSTYATNASSNFGPNWQRDHDYFVSAAAKPVIYQAIADRVDAMWNDPVGFGPLRLTPPNAADLASPASNVTGVAPGTSLVWNIAAWAVSYDVYLGTSQSNMTLVDNVPAQMVLNPPATYAWTPPAPLQSGTTYVWKIVSRTNTTALVPSMIATSSIWSFTTAGTTGPPAAPGAPSPSNGATGVGRSATLGWSAGAGGTTYNVAIGTTSSPPQVAAGLSTPSYAPGLLAASTTYYWRVTAVSSGGSTAGALWSFVTGTGSGGGATDVVIYASDVTPSGIHGAWSQVADATAAAGIKLSSPDAGAAALGAPLSNPVDYFDVPFQAAGGTRYRVWLRVRSMGNSKWNDSLFVQFSDSSDSGGSAIYRIGTTGGLVVNLSTDSTGSSNQGWGWPRNAYWLSDTGEVWFQNSGAHTIRVQVREDGVEIDQIVISPVTYATSPPGLVSNDSTIVPKPGLTPPAPGLPGPPNGATGVDADVTLTWNGSGATSYDVRFGTSNPPTLASAGIPSESYAPGTLNDATTYFWQVVAHSSSGTTSSAVWSFTTASATPAAPGAPGAPNPANGAANVPATITLTWAGSGATSFDVRFGTINPPPQVSTGQASASYAPPALSPGTTYFWQVVARNASGATPSPLWSFSTTAAPPPPPGLPASPNPVSGAAGIGTTPVLTWTSAGATSYDVRFGTTNPPAPVTSAQATASYTPAPLAGGVTYFWQIVARNAGGTTTGAVWSFTTAIPPADIVIDAIDLPASALHGSWAAAADGSSPNGIKLATPDNGWATNNNPLAAPVDYVDVTFNAPSGTPYTFWIRLKALDNSKYNDAVWVQFSDARANGSPIYPLNSTAGLLVNLATDATASSNVGWGWVNSAYWLAQPVTVSFAQPGTHTVRVQLREDGVSFDQIVLSPSTYLNAAPGARTNDSTIIPTSSGPGVPTSNNPTDHATSVSTTPALAWSAAGATSYDVRVGTTNPPPLATSGVTGASYAPGTLTTNATYFWQIVARNGGGTTTGPVWSFTTTTPPPSTPASPTPTNGATAVSRTPTLGWSSPGATSFDVQFGLSNPPAQVSAAQAAASYAPGLLSRNRKYFWRVVSHNAAGTTTGPVWSFTTTSATAGANIVIDAGAIAAANPHGRWTVASGPTPPDGMTLVTPDSDRATNSPLTAPVFNDSTRRSVRSLPADDRDPHDEWDRS
jgi:hypothetical protein